MRNNDINSLTSLYESKIVPRNFLNEETPYTGDEDMAGKIAAMEIDPNVHKAAMSPKYGPGTSSNLRRLSPEEMKRAAIVIGKEVNDFLSTLPDKTFAYGSTTEEENTAFRKKIADIVVAKLKRKTGDPFYSKSFAVYIAKQLVYAYLSAGALKHTKPGGGGEGGGGGSRGGGGGSDEADF
jgi:hypothetical protein